MSPITPTSSAESKPSGGGSAPDPAHARRLADGRACLDAALRYRELGLSALALCPGDHVGIGRDHSHKCTSRGKRPWHQWRDYQSRLPLAQEIVEWWRRHPNSNVGCALGPVSNLVRLDIDGAAAGQQLAEISGGNLPSTWTFRSGRADGSGRGILYGVPPGIVFRTTPQAFRDGELRFLAQGAQTVLPPSRHKDGALYEWLEGHSPGEIPLAPAPAWVVARWAVGANGAAPRQQAPALCLDDGALIRRGGRNQFLWRTACSLRRQGWTQAGIRDALELAVARCEDLPGDPRPGAAVLDGMAQRAGAYASALVVPRECEQDRQAARFQPPGRPAGDAPSAAVLEFPRPVPLDRLVVPQRTNPWILHGYIAPGEITLLAAMFKAGKTTLLSHFLRLRQSGGSFLGRPLSQGRTLYVTEEPERIWESRRVALGLDGTTHVLFRPITLTPSPAKWVRFIDYLAGLVEEGGFDLVVIDPLNNIWPVEDENDAAQVKRALLPLRRLTDRGAGLLPTHHLSKADGGQGTGSRGSTALPAFVDTIIELRRYDQVDEANRGRVLRAYGRWDETPRELVIELTEEGEYTARGDRRLDEYAQLRPDIEGVLLENPGAAGDRVEAGLSPRQGLRRGTLLACLKFGAEQQWWLRTGAGRRGCPYRYTMPNTNDNH